MPDKVYDFGYRIKELRERKNMSQGDLASKLNIEPATVSGYERNVTTPSLEVFKDLVSVLDTTADYLLGLDNKDSIRFTDLSDKQAKFLLQTKDNIVEYDK